jgi:hypothetical protein
VRAEEARTSTCARRTFYRKNQLEEEACNTIGMLTSFFGVPNWTPARDKNHRKSGVRSNPFWRVVPTSTVYRDELDVLEVSTPFRRRKGSEEQNAGAQAVFVRLCMPIFSVGFVSRAVHTHLSTTQHHSLLLTLILDRHGRQLSVSLL